MPIASKLFYFQRRRPPAPQDPQPPDPSRSLRRHKPGQELARGRQRSTSEHRASTESITKPAGGILFSSRQSSNVSDNRLPDEVRQARERLHQRLRNVYLSRGRQDLPGVFDITSCFYSSDYSSNKAQENTAEFFSSKENGMSELAPCSKPVSELQQQGFKLTKEGKYAESSVDCSICLEQCGDADRLIQLHCKHIFHSACLFQWLQSHGDCPYCRASMLLSSMLLSKSDRMT